MPGIFRSLTLLGFASAISTATDLPDEDLGREIQVKLTYDTLYDEDIRPLPNLKCWNPDSRRIRDYEWQVQGDVQGPIIAVDSIDGYNSSVCGRAFWVQYGEMGRCMFALDGAPKGKAVTSLWHMNEFTKGQAVRLGEIDVVINRTPRIDCGYAGFGRDPADWDEL